METFKLFKHAVDALCDPRVMAIGSFVGFFVIQRYYRVWTRPAVAGSILGAGLVFMAFGLTDHHFHELVTKPDNVPIVGLLFLVAFFWWLSMRQAAINDERIEKGLGPREKDETAEKVLVWPDLVYEELICMVILTVVLIVWSVLLKAPLEPPANPAATPNPSKAPWYFLGLQEMLVYFDPWLAGVVLPSIMIVGLMAIPYIDKNPVGAGYYTYKERRFAINVYMFGFIPLWVLLVIQGTFLRGPNWNFFGPFEEWDIHKLLPLNNVNLSEYVYIRWLGVRLPENPLVREAPGILLTLGYFFVLPPLLAKTILKPYFIQMGFIRYNVMVIGLLLPMVSLIVKMFLRWTINLKYIVAIPEIFFNI